MLFKHMIHNKAVVKFQKKFYKNFLTSKKNLKKIKKIVQKMKKLSLYRLCICLTLVFGSEYHF